MSSQAAPPTKRRRLDANNVPQQPQQSYERNVAGGNSRNVYGNIYHGPVSYAGIPAAISETDDTHTAENLLEALTFVEREDRLATIGKAHDETCQWLFERDEYKAWRDPDKRHLHHGFFWIKGKPGTGKSTLMKCAYNRGLDEFSDDVIVSFFFNARGAQLQKSMEGMYRSLLCQLLERMPQLAARLPRRACERLQKPGWPIELLKDVLREALLLVDSARLTCYVDALDECQDEDAREMIEFFDRLGTSAVAANVSVHILLSSRHYPQIHIPKCQQLILEHQSDHASDIVRYIESKLEIGSSVTARDIKSTLLRKASGVFLWVVLVVQILNEHKRHGLVHELKQRVDGIPKNLDKLFAEILQGGPSEAPYTLSMLKLIAFASRPLTREEVYHAVLYSESQHEITSLIDVTQEDMENFIINCSKGLAEMTKGMRPTVQLIHESVRNHLLDTGLRPTVPLSGHNLSAWCHENLKALCLGYVEKSALALLQRPECGQKEHLSDHFMDINELKRQTSTSHPFLDYALDGVITHAQQAHCEGRPQYAYMKTFPIETWIRLHNILVASHNLRLSRDATVVYILVIKGASQLVKLITQDASWRPDTGNLASNEQHRTLMGVATDMGDYEMLDMLLATGVPPSSDAKDGQSCLSLAIGKGDATICRRLIAAGAKVNNISTRSRPSDLRLAHESGFLEIVQALLQHPHYANHLDTNFEADLKFALRRYARSNVLFEELIPFIDKALENSSGSDPESPSSKAATHAIHTAVLRAACQRADIGVIKRTIDQGAVGDNDLLQSSFVAGNLDVIELLLGVRADIKPSTPEVPIDTGYRDSKLIRLLLDTDENLIDPILDAVYPTFSKFSTPKPDQFTLLPPAIYPAHTSRHANARDLRFARILPLAVYHGDPWVSVLKRLLDNDLHVNNREDYIDTALRCACYLERTETLRMLLDWCRESPLKYESLPGLGYGLVFLARTLQMAMIQEILDSKLKVPVDMFREAYYSSHLTHPALKMNFERRFLVWAVERSSHDVGFASDLEFVPRGDIGDQHRLREHLRGRQSLWLHAAKWNTMIGPGTK